MKLFLFLLVILAGCTNVTTNTPTRINTPHNKWTINYIHKGIVVENSSGYNFVVATKDGDSTYYCPVGDRMRLIYVGDTIVNF